MHQIELIRYFEVDQQFAKYRSWPRPAVSSDQMLSSGMGRFQLYEVSEVEVPVWASKQTKDYYNLYRR
jgi:hypothetical protein